MNTDEFLKHPRIIYIKQTYNLKNKSNFINMCDGMIHARQRGESFGLAISEFLFLNKPVISCLDGLDQNHIEILKDKGLWYSNYNECLNQLLSFYKKNMSSNYYSSLIQEYSPKKVMQKFNKLFLT